MNGLGFAFFSLAIALGALGLFAWLWARDRLGRSGLPAGDVIYSDDGAWFRQERPLFSRRLRLVGKPDYLVRQKDGAVLPVELKSAGAPDRPFPGHVLQLAAYCLLVEESFGARPPHGIIQYRDRAFAVEFTYELESELLEVLDEMHSGLEAADLSRDHDDPRRCAACGVRAACGESLV
jgi:CRISPR-associated exonuclease Cas4